MVGAQDTAEGLGRQVELIRQQAAACRELGSPFYEALLGDLADDVAAGGVGARVLAGHEDDPGPSALALRVMAAVHRLVLTGRASALAAHYLSAGGDGNTAAARPAFRATLKDHMDEVRAGLASPPQTNEVGRSAALFGGLLQVLTTADRPDLPVRLLEIGASAGLNLLSDQFVYRAADGSEPWRMTDGTDVVLDPAWATRPHGILPAVQVVERRGCDLSPIEARSEEGAVSLLSCVWPDQTHRLERLRGALAVARKHPVELVRAGGGDFLDDLELRDGHHTVVWHSVMWQYVPATEQQRMLDRLTALGATATADRLLGEAPPHGVPVRWGDPRTP